MEEKKEKGKPGAEITKELLLHVAETARLNLTDDEISEFLPQLKDVIKAFSKLSELDTETISPSFQPVEIRNVLREDLPEESLSQEDALKNAKYTKDGYFKGPKII